MSVQVSK